MAESEPEVIEKVLEYQALFEQFNEGGSIWRIDFGDGDGALGMVDSYTVVRAAADAFWLLVKQPYYNDGFHQPQQVHTIKVVEWGEGDDTWQLDLVDDLGRRYHIELLFPALDVDRYAFWRRWRRYKAGRKAAFRLADADILADSMETAESWPR